MFCSVFVNLFKFEKIVHLFALGIVYLINVLLQNYFQLSGCSYFFLFSLFVVLFVFLTEEDDFDLLYAIPDPEPRYDAGNTLVSPSRLSS